MHINFQKIKAFYNKVDEALYPIIGLHRYDAYLEHFKKHHPGETPLSRAEFFKESQDAKGKNVKCC